MNVRPSDHRHLHQATLHAFVAEGLSAEARRDVVAHCAACLECRTMLLRTVAPASNHAAGGRRRIARAGLAALFVAGSILLVLEIRRRVVPVTPRDELRGIANAMSHRMTPGRLSGGFAYRPQPATNAETNGDGLRARARAVVHRAGGDPRLAAAAALLAGDYDTSIGLLETALRQSAKDADLFNDLAVAHFARARKTNYASDFAASLNAAARAWRLARSPEAAWNRALAVSEFHLREAAQAAWDDVLRVEPDAHWREEARLRREAAAIRRESTEGSRLQATLSREGIQASAAADMVRHEPARALEYFEETLLPRWADEQLHSTRRHVELRRQARIIADALADTGEQFARDSIRAIEISCQTPASCTAIARAHASYAHGRRLMESQKYQQASTVLEAVAADFAALHSPYANAVRVRLGSCLIHGNRFDDAARLGSTLQQTIPPVHRTLRARALWLLGLATLHAARPEDSIRHYNDALRLFTEAHDDVNIGSIEFLLADAYEYAGDPHEAMNHRLAGMKAVSRTGKTTGLHVGLFEAGSSATRRGLLDAGEFLLAECERLANEHRRYTVASVASIWRSTIAARQNDYETSSRHARSARSYWMMTTDPGQRALIAASGDIAVGSSAAISSPSDALSETIRFFESAGNRAWLPQLLRQRALLSERNGDVAAAEADFARAIDILEEVRQGGSLLMRHGFSDDTRPTYEHMIRLLLARGETRKALAYADRARGARSRGREPAVDQLAAIDTLAPSLAAAMFEQQQGTVVVWLMTRGSVRTLRWHVPDDLPELAVDSPAALATTYDWLIRPWIQHVPAGAELVILPPPPFNGVPFGALLNRDTGRSVIDDHVVWIASSLAALDRKVPALSAEDSVLVVGDPSYSELPRLPSSRREAFTAARHYRTPSVLVGDEATAARVRERLHDADVFHFAGHALANELVPSLSSIVLASIDGARDERIYVHELMQQRSMKLVVLSACSTAKSRSGGSGGTVTIARAFLDGGASTVVGTLWPVPDDDAATFSRIFHGRLTQGDSAPAAARAAQLHLRSISKGDQTWAAFCVFQGTASSTGGTN